MYFNFFSGWVRLYCYHSYITIVLNYDSGFKYMAPNCKKNTQTIISNEWVFYLLIKNKYVTTKKNMNKLKWISVDNINSSRKSSYNLFFKLSTVLPLYITSVSGGPWKRPTCAMWLPFIGLTVRDTVWINGFPRLRTVSATCNM